MTKRNPAPKVQPTTEKLTPKLAWFELCKLHAEGDKLRAEGSKLHAEGSKLHAEGSKLHAEGGKLLAEGSKLRAEGRLIFSQAVIDYHGPKTEMHWTDTGCTVEGREYKFEEPV